jgi:hypothetical protein
MKISRSTPVKKKTATLKKPTKRRPARRYVDPATQVAYTSALDNGVNNPQTFTYMDYERNKSMINVLRKNYEDIIRMYGVDLQYFRKFNTFFQDDSENMANMIYGEDTTAEYYISGMVRAFLNIENYNWQFNMMGIEAAEQITINIGIEDFRCRFATLVGKTSGQVFEVPVTGSLVSNEYRGVIDIPEFYAVVEGEIPDNLKLKNVPVYMQERSINSQFYQSITHVTNLYPITGGLTGDLIEDDCIPFKVSGLLKGELTYHTLDNIENSPTWNIAPQVGDYFRLVYGEIEEEYEINQIVDRVLTNQNGINPLLGKYIFQCIATRRASSHEEFNHNYSKDTPGEDITDNLLMELSQSGGFKKDLEETNLPSYTKEIPCEENTWNNSTNKIANNIYTYKDNADYTYGGYQDYPSE